MLNTNIYSRGIEWWTVENKTLKGPGENIGEFLSDLRVGKLYLNMTAKEENSMSDQDW